MASSPRTTGFWWFQAIFWSVAGTALFISGATQMPLVQALVRNLYLLLAGFMSSFFLAFGQWFSGTMNFALVYAFWSELFIQRIYADPKHGQQAEQRPDRLVVEHRGELLPLPLTEVSSITAAGDYVEIHAGGRKYLYRQTLQALEDNLGGGTFLRIHRSALVNADLVESISPLGKGRYRLRLRDGSVATSSRGYRNVVQETFLASAA